MENDILDALEDLGCNIPFVKEEGAFTRAIEGELLTFDFMSLCVWLLTELKKVCPLGESLTEVEDAETFKLEMSGILNELGNPHPVLSGTDSLNNVPNRLLLLDYLTSELQACRMLDGVKDDKMEIDQQAISPTLEHVNSILLALQVPLPTKDTSVFTIFSQMEHTIRQLLGKLPKDFLGNPLLQKRLGESQWNKVEQINNQLNSEYSLRRQMLLKRLDVTIQSFGWSDQAKAKKDEMTTVFQPLRRAMSSSASVTVADVIASRTDLLRQPRTSSGAEREKTKCAINRVLMGKVPDRGGRPSTMNPPPPEMPSFRKREEAPKNQRPHSSRGGPGGRGRGGGRGGRGGKVQGGWGGDDRGGRGGHGKWGGGRGGHRNENPFGQGEKSHGHRDVYYS
ncbi:protein FAM98B [Exaiptasia diaphana]|uniref:Protein FAM98A n=1 Tax=Exaiptasia diaphana TaxID=2652724 RepID=A0A913XS81_EXADI|nr:protein FAM98B [Exaiptasia diaphana]